MGVQTLFKRTEAKYLLTKETFAVIYAAVTERLARDEYPEYTVFNVYYDTPDSYLIRTSLEKPPYKEKVRLRSYGVPKPDDTVFLELKKKYKGVVYKRRVKLTFAQANEYFETGVIPKPSQIFSEIDYVFHKYDLKPAIFLAYDRQAYYGENDLRITFDFRIRARYDDVRLDEERADHFLLGDGEALMEIKMQGAYPPWLIKLLSDNKVYKTSFSKYGKFYTQSAGKTKQDESKE